MSGRSRQWDLMLSDALRKVRLVLIGVSMLATGTALLARALPAGAQQTYTARSCSYWSDAPSKVADGPCQVRTTEQNGNFAVVLTFRDGTRVMVEYVDRQSGYHKWKINGQPGFGVEVNREHFKGASLDLKQIVEWDSNAPGRR